MAFTVAIIASSIIAITQAATPQYFIGIHESPTGVVTHAYPLDQCVTSIVGLLPADDKHSIFSCNDDGTELTHIQYEDPSCDNPTGVNATYTDNSDSGALYSFNCVGDIDYTIDRIYDTTYQGTPPTCCEDVSTLVAGVPNVCYELDADQGIYAMATCDATNGDGGLYAYADSGCTTQVAEVFAPNGSCGLYQSEPGLFDLYHITEECYENGVRLFCNELCGSDVCITDEPTGAPTQAPIPQYFIGIYQAPTGNVTHAYPLDYCVTSFVGLLPADDKHAIFSCNDDGTELTYTQYEDPSCDNPTGITDVYTDNSGSGALYSFNCDGDIDYTLDRIYATDYNGEAPTCCEDVSTLVAGVPGVCYVLDPDQGLYAMATCDATNGDGGLYAYGDAGCTTQVAEIFAPDGACGLYESVDPLFDLYHITEECYENGELLFYNDLCVTDTPTTDPSEAPSMTTGDPTTSPSMEPTSSPVDASGTSGAIVFGIDVKIMAMVMILSTLFGI